MPDIRNVELVRSVQTETGSVLDERAKLRDTIASNTAEIERLDREALRLEVAGDRASAETLRTRIATAKASRTEALSELRQADDRVRDLLGRIGRVDPCDADPAIPLVLLPVRVETRYTKDKATLRVRIFPDAVHIDQLDRGMTDEESDAGRAFWRGAAAGGEALSEAWTALMGAVGSRRAQWVALGLTPLNREAWLQGAEPEFPTPGPRGRGVAVARLLPDHFVVVARQGRQRVTARTRPVAPEVVAGLLSNDGSELVEIAGVKVPPGGEWMVDCAEAVRAGLAVDLELARPGAVDRLFVVGVRRNLGPERSRDELAALFTGHRCARGLTFVPQGSPTNNTDADRSEWSTSAEPKAPEHVLGSEPSSDSSGVVLARALGIVPDVFHGIDHAELPEQARAQAMNAALWPASWGAFLDRLTQPDSHGTHVVLSDASEQVVRDFFRDHVRARGPLPTLRVGDQPYGFLPVASSVTARWSLNDQDRVDAALFPLLRRLRAWWEHGVEFVPRIGAGGDIDETFREILGMFPVSQALRVRNIVTGDARSVAAELGFAEANSSEAEQDLERIFHEVVVYPPVALHSLGSLSINSRPLPFPIVHASDPEYMKKLLDGSPPASKSLLQAMLRLALDSAERDVNAAAPKDKVRDMAPLATGLDPRRRAFVLSVAGEATMDSSRLHLEADRLVTSTGMEESGRMTLKQFQPVAAYRTSYAELALDSGNADAKAEFALRGTIAWLRAKARLAEVREAIEALRQTELRERAILFGELLDLSSHRLDAWLTGLVDRRLTGLRAKTPQGLTIGAFGWVENLKPGAGARPDGGYIHAPSLDHAATAGILRSAFLTHNADENGDGAFAIDLSSDRVRTALHLVDGVQQGQQLGALLGYRIERALHEAGLDRLILTLRGLAPLVARRLTDREDDVPAPAAESIAANNVVDGIRLIERYNESAQARDEIHQALREPPADNPYVEGDDWPELTGAEWKTVQRIIQDADAANDAAADLLLAESVQQLVRGNTARASATLSAAGSGEVPPPDPEIIKTPAPGMPFAHRVMLVVEGDAAPWNPGRPRALAEPALEVWAAGRLGNPSNVTVAEGANGGPVTLADSGLCALDIVYDAADRRTLEQRVRAALPQLDVETPLARRRRDDWPAGRLAFGEVAELAAALRAVLVTATPAEAADFSRASDEPARTISDASVADVRARGTEARGLLSTALDALLAAMAPPGGAAADPDAVAAALEELAAFGAVAPAVKGENILAIAEVAAAEARRRIDAADQLLGASEFDADDAADLGHAIFGDGFWMLPLIDPPAASDLFGAAWGSLTPARAELRRFVRDVGSVREPVARLSKALLLGDALGRPATLGVAQLATGAYPWVGGVLGADFPSPDEPVTNVVVDAPEGWIPTVPLSALIVDQWTDVVPQRTAVGAEADEPPEVGDRRASGLAVNAASASSRPPQAVLLAISPDGARWTTDRLVEVLEETLALARLRVVSLEAGPGAGRLLPALHLPGWSVGAERVFDFRYAAAHAHLDAALAYIKEQI